MEHREYKTVIWTQADKLIEAGWHIYSSNGRYVTLFRIVAVKVFEEWGPEHTKHIAS